MKIAGAKEIVEEMVAKMGIADSGSDGSMGEGTADMVEAMLRYMPLRSTLSFSGGEIAPEQVEALIELIHLLSVSKSTITINQAVIAM